MSIRSSHVSMPKNIETSDYLNMTETIKSSSSAATFKYVDNRAVHIHEKAVYPVSSQHSTGP